MAGIMRQWKVTAQDGKAGFDALELSEQPVPECGDGQVLVKRERPLCPRRRRGKENKENSSG